MPKRELIIEEEEEETIKKQKFNQKHVRFLEDSQKIDELLTLLKENKLKPLERAIKKLTESYIKPLERRKEYLLHAFQDCCEHKKLVNGKCTVCNFDYHSF